jgi:hypothetical protein
MDAQLQKLLSTVGIPNVLESKHEIKSVDPVQKRIAQKNKIALLYCLALDSIDESLLAKNQLLFTTIKSVSGLFNENNVDYAVFKTVKPFKTTPSDIDILVSDNSFAHAAALLSDVGYKELSKDAYSATLSKEMIVDLQLQPSVSNLPYLDKDYLMQNRTVRNIENAKFFGLTDEAEIAIVACHSIYKELMFTLNDYYTITILAERLNVSDIIRAAKATKSIDVFKIIFGLCRRITEEAFGMELNVNEVSRQLGTDYPQVETMPTRFPLSMVVRLLISRATKDTLVRSNAFPAIIKSMSVKQITRFVSHLGRDTY